MLSGFVSRGPIIGNAEIDAFQRWCGFDLPPEYRQFLLEQNGGERASVQTLEEALEADGWPREHRFFSLNAAAAAGLSAEDAAAFGNEIAEAWPGAQYDLEVQTRWHRGNGDFRDYPPELLPVALVYHHDLLLLRLAEPHPGAVLYAWDPDGYCEWHLGEVASSFAELLRDFESHEWA